MNYFNSNDKNVSIIDDDFSLFLDTLNFKVNSCGIWSTNIEKIADYTINDIEFIFYSKGGSTTNILGNQYTCNTNDFMILEPYGLYRSHNKKDENSEYHYIHFDIEPKISQDNFLQMLKKNSSVFHISNPDIFFELFYKIQKEVQNQNSGYATMINSYIKQMCVLLVRNNQLTTSKVNYKKLVNNTQADIVNSCISFISKNIDGDLSITALSKQLNVSENYLYKCFVSVLNITPSKYIQKYRILRAKSMILSNKLTIEQISQQLGYSSLIHFSRAFKNEEKIAPTKYQKLKSHQLNLIKNIVVK